MKNKKLFAILTLVCFMFTLMPVAAFAAVDADESYVYTEDANAKEEVGEDVTIQFDFNNDATTTVYVWFLKDDSKVASKSVTGPVEADNYGIFKIEAKEGKDYDFQFASAGKYVVKAALSPVDFTDKTKAEAFADAEDVLRNLTDHKTIEITSSSSSRDYAVKVEGAELVDGDVQLLDTGLEDDKTTEDKDESKKPNTDYYTDGAVFKVTGQDADNVFGGKITLAFVDAKGAAVKGEKVEFSTNSSNIELNKESATTSQLGKVDFKVAASAEGTYKVYATIGSFEVTINVVVGATGAAYINIDREPSAPVDIDTVDLKDFVRFSFTDINGNAVKIEDIENTEKAFDADTNHVSIISKPADSDLEDSDVKLIQRGNNANQATISVAGGLDAEGTYEFKVVLNNGNYKVVTVEVKEFKTPVAINLTYAAPSVELGGNLYVDKLEYVDANGVVKSAKGKVDLAATGYAVENFDTTEGTIKAKSDEKYIGSEITVTAVDERYNLVANATVTVADDAKEIKFATNTADVDVNNKINAYLADAQGNRVAPGTNVDKNNEGETVKGFSISFVVLDKPEGAKVSANLAESTDFLSSGSFKMSLTSNKVGNVTVQAIAKVTKTVSGNQSASEKEVVKYYTGTQIFAVGTEGTGDVVVMSIGSNEIIVNDAKATIDAAPIIENNRTFVPFRALAEAFGATVAYDEATQAVTAELNGTTVVMTIGSATYTVNGVEKTADVAPFINGSRTMVPVRFAAEAFG
ncbi:MAG: copper amine oxidase N-terminal domain-containing protein, partial [Peptococcaceae bacterium]|nr:copper amine oxidase N-terminal domain-containing protein [Peptococcaceae bacterium]